ncbi:MAG TPA: glycolate oxidase subunit GlcE [Burkholderiales bacterium]|nr:glycolate oxidase subunit GlcE [Burkholderiales bacterium]
MSLAEFQQRIQAAASGGTGLRLRGGGSKDFYGDALRGDILDTRGYAGIVAYEPTELVVTARCGTPLSELEQILEGNGQCLAFEPPHFGPGATVGGCVAAGLSGPRRASVGALRDFVLGVKLIDGRGQALAFGGQVMKNVAGYDVSRLAAGSLGTLGVIAEVSLKLAPKPQAEATLRLEAPQARALELMNRWAGQPLPLSATAWRDGALTVRLSGSAEGVRAAAAKIGGAALAEPFWDGIREQTDPFFSGPEPLWRLSVPSTSPPLELQGRQLVEWNGALRWLKSHEKAQTIRDAVRGMKGHATLFRAADKSAGCFSPLEPVLERVHRQLKAAFDPGGIFNPGRMYPEL